jgi:hypothetical protein
MNKHTLPITGVVCGLVAVSIFATDRWVVASESAPAPSVAITRADDGKTVVLRVGDRFLVQLGDEFDWSVSVSDPSIVRRVPNVLVVRGAQGIFEAARAGETDLVATGVLHCAPNQPCPALAAVFRVHIVVSATLAHRAMVSGLARDGGDQRKFTVTGSVLAGPTCPVERVPPDAGCSDRVVSGAEVIFVDDMEQQVGDVVSDVDGRFSVVLPAGKYVVSPQPLLGLLGTAPPQAILIADADIAVTLRYDTGIR